MTTDAPRTDLPKLVEALRARRDSAEPVIAEQVALITEDGFYDLVQLARIHHPADTGRSDAPETNKTAAEILAEWPEGASLREQLRNQLRDEIRFLLEFREELQEVRPLDRLPARAEIEARVGARGEVATDRVEGPSGKRFQQVFPVRDADGWLVIRKFPEKRPGPSAAANEPSAGSLRFADSGEPTPHEVFAAELSAGADLDASLERYRQALLAATGVLPIRVRTRAEQERLRRLEQQQIERTFAAVDGGSRLIEAGCLDRLVALLAERDPFPVLAKPDVEIEDWDDLRPLPFLWDAILRFLGGDPSIVESKACRPQLSRTQIEGLGISLTAAERDAVLERLPHLPSNAFLSVFSVEEMASRQVKGGPLERWLCGVKDVFALGRTTAASASLERFGAQIEAAVVERLRQAGCLFPGKTNLDEFALGSSSETSAFKPTPGCPAHRLRVAGGSSGGSAAAVAAGLVRFALGSDTAGSIRLPSSYCGVVGWKPSYGMVPRYGLLPLSMGLDVVGLLTRDVSDCIDVAKVIVGEDVRDETTHGVDRATFTSDLDEESRNDGPRRIGVPIEYFLNVNGPMADLYLELEGKQDLGALQALAASTRDTILEQAGVERFEDLTEDQPIERSLATLDKLTVIPAFWKRFRDALERLEGAGWTWQLVSLPHTWLSIPTYFALSRAELASNLHRYDGITFGSRSHVFYQDLQRTTRAEHFGFQPKIRTLMGIHALQQEKVCEDKNSTITDDFLRLAKQARRRITEDFEKVFDQEVDLLLTPTANVVAPAFGGIADTIAQQRLDELTVPANLAGTAAITLPFGRLRDRKDGPPLPTSLQLIAPRFADARLLVAAQRIESILRDEESRS